MAEFKVNKELSGEINQLKCVGLGPCTVYGPSPPTTIDSDEVSSLKTAMKYIAQHEAIAALIVLYDALIAKDADDLLAFVAEVEGMDNSIASGNGGGGFR